LIFWTYFLLGRIHTTLHSLAGKFVPNHTSLFAISWLTFISHLWCVYMCSYYLTSKEVHFSTDEPESCANMSLNSCPPPPARFQFY
jgi:hypothetical protein